MTATDRTSRFIQIGAAMARARADKELSKSAASRDIGVSRMTYDMWERDAWVPGVERAEEIATFCDLPKVDVLAALLRANGILDADTYLELKRGSSR